MPVVPYVPAATFLARETAKLASRDGEPRRVALVVDAAGSMHGVSQTIDRIREHGVPGWEVEVIGTDPHVDRRLPAVAEVEIPFYAGLEVGVPSVPELVQTLAEGRYDLVHVASPGPAGVGAAICARIANLPLIGSYHTELAAYAAIRTGDATLETGMRLALALFYGQCELVLSPSPAADQSLVGIGIESERIARWARGVDLSLYDPAKRDPGAFPGQVKVLYAGRLTKEKGVDLLADAFLRARERDPRLHLLLAGGGPEEGALRERLGVGQRSSGGEGSKPLRDLPGMAGPRAAGARLRERGPVPVLLAHRHLRAGDRRGPGQRASRRRRGRGGPVSLISDRHTGWLCPPDPESLAGAVAPARLLGLSARAAVACRARRGPRTQLGSRLRAAGGRLLAGADSGARRVGSPQPRQRIAA